MNDNENVEESIFLGGQISGKHPIYKDLAQLASSGFVWWLLKTSQDLEWKKKTPQEKIQDIIYTSGQIEFINNSSELTKLSAIMGDTRKRYSQKGLKDELTARIYQSPQP
jgi:hypothetical protein